MNPLDIPWIEARLAGHDPRLIPEEQAPRRAAVAAILRQVGHPAACELLFIRRAKDEQDPWSGHMAFPGGRMESNDQSPLEAAHRETREEVDIDIARHGRLLGRIDDVRASAGGRVLPLSVSPFVFQLIGPAEPTRSEEVEEVHWVPISALLNPKNGSTVPYTIGDRPFDLPCFKVHDRIIWGLTYQMLMKLFAVLRWEVGMGGER